MTQAPPRPTGYGGADFFLLRTLRPSNQANQANPKSPKVPKTPKSPKTPKPTLKPNFAVCG